MKLHLRDHGTELTDAWSRAFAGAGGVEVSCGPIFDVSACAVVSPANSFGFMDGGIDLVYSRFFGWDLQRDLQARISEEFGGELPVGSALVVGTGHESVPYLISAPTMRVPLDVSDTLNAYLAFRAALLAARDFEASSPGLISSVLCPGPSCGSHRTSAASVSWSWTPRDCRRRRTCASSTTPPIPLRDASTRTGACCW